MAHAHPPSQRPDAEARDYPLPPPPPQQPWLNSSDHAWPWMNPGVPHPNSLGAPHPAYQWQPQAGAGGANSRLPPVRHHPHDLRKAFTSGKGHDRRNPRVNGNRSKASHKGSKKTKRRGGNRASPELMYGLMRPHNASTIGLRHGLRRSYHERPPTAIVLHELNHQNLGSHPVWNCVGPLAHRRYHVADMGCILSFSQYKLIRSPHAGSNRLPPSCKLPDGTMFTLDSALRQGIIDCPAGDPQMFGTNVDILKAIEGHSPRQEGAGEDVESGDEASCPEAPLLSSEGDSDDDASCLPDNVKALVLSDKRQLALYTAHLEEKVCVLQKVCLYPCSVLFVPALSSHQTSCC